MKSFILLLLKVKVLIDHYVEKFSNNLKILFLIGEIGLKSPKELCKVLNMAKSNLAILASKLKEEKYIIQEKGYNNDKEIFYSITESGKMALQEKIEDIKIDEKAQQELIKNIKTLLNK